MIKILAFLSLAAFSCGTQQLKYNYASSDARVHCSLDCPGRNCICILGNNNTWYISPEIGDE
jgi:hypothetical protein